MGHLVSSTPTPTHPLGHLGKHPPLVLNVVAPRASSPCPSSAGPCQPVQCGLSDRWHVCHRTGQMQPPQAAKCSCSLHAAASMQLILRAAPLSPACCGIVLGCPVGIASQGGRLTAPSPCTSKALMSFMPSSQLNRRRSLCLHGRSSGTRLRLATATASAPSPWCAAGAVGGPAGRGVQQCPPTSRLASLHSQLPLRLPHPHHTPEGFLQLLIPWWAGSSPCCLMLPHIARTVLKVCYLVLFRMAADGGPSDGPVLLWHGFRDLQQPVSGRCWQPVYWLGLTGWLAGFTPV